MAAREQACSKLHHVCIMHAYMHDLMHTRHQQLSVPCSLAEMAPVASAQTMRLQLPLAHHCPPS